MSKELTAVSLFTGAGGMDVGFERAGIKVVFANELMKEAAQTYILIDFRAFYGLDKFSLKQINQYVWQLGKDYFPKNYGKKKRGDKYFVFNR